MTAKRFPECDRCVNYEYDPFECESCVKGDGFEPQGPEDENIYDEMTISEFAEVWREL